MISEKRVLEVTRLLEAGCKDTDVADELDIDPATAKRYRTEINRLRQAAGMKVFTFRRGRRPEIPKGEMTEWAGKERNVGRCSRDWPADYSEHNLVVVE